MLELRKFDLEFALVRTRTLGEDVEDETGAIDDAALGILFQIALLHGRERVIDEDQIGVERGALRLQLLGLAGSDEEFGIRLLDACGERANDCGTGRASKLAELVDAIRVSPCRGIFAYPTRLQQQRAFTFARTFKQG